MCSTIPLFDECLLLYLKSADLSSILFTAIFLFPCFCIKTRQTWLKMVFIGKVFGHETPALGLFISKMPLSEGWLSGWNCKSWSQNIRQLVLVIPKPEESCLIYSWDLSFIIRELGVYALFSYCRFPLACHSFLKDLKTGFSCPLKTSLPAGELQLQVISCFHPSWQAAWRNVWTNMMICHVSASISGFVTSNNRLMLKRKKLTLMFSHLQLS